MDLLVLLASAGGRVVSKDEIIAVVWHGRFISEASLTRTMADLRRALDDTARQPRYIETIPKRGYRLVEAVLPIQGAEKEGRRPGAPMAPVEPPRDAEPSLAVLPFTDLGPGDPDRSFGDGLTEEVINVVTRVPGLRVIARTSSFAAAALGSDIDDIGKRLGVTHLLEGSVRRAGGRVRVAAQLIRASDRCHVWSERYDRRLTDVFAIQDDIADAIATRLELSLGEPARRGRWPTESVEAYTAFLEARHHFIKGTPDSLTESLRCLETAIRIDPGMAAAHDALGELYWYMGFYGALVPKDAFLKASWETLRALELDDSMAEAHALLALLHKELDCDWAKVRREFERAFERDPRSPTVRLRHAFGELLPFARLDEAAAEVRTVLENDPLSAFARWWLVVMLFLAGDARSALEEVDRLLAIEPQYPPAHMIRGGVLLMRGDAGGAVTACERAVECGGGAPWLQGWLGQALAFAGRRAEAEALRARLMEQSGSTYVPPTAIAWISLALGDVDDGFARMEEAVDVRDPLIMPIRSYPFLEPIRGEARYSALLAKMHLA